MDQNFVEVHIFVQVRMQTSANIRNERLWIIQKLNTFGFRAPTVLNFSVTNPKNWLFAYLWKTNSWTGFNTRPESSGVLKLSILLAWRHLWMVPKAAMKSNLILCWMKSELLDGDAVHVVLDKQGLGRSKIVQQNLSCWSPHSKIETVSEGHGGDLWEGWELTSWSVFVGQGL